MMMKLMLFRWFLSSPAKRIFSSIRGLSNEVFREHFNISPEVENCLQTNAPLVALESTIITHGMPYPHNLKTTQSIQTIIRENGATPALIAILGGRIHIGLNNKQLEDLSKSNCPVTKISRRDLAVAIAKKLNGGTTVSATMLIAHRVGIPIFVTGGIGGVHKGAESSFDISADLTELGRTPVTVISSGVKSILDINKTLEYLETQGVTVVTFGTSKEFPSFFTSKSGLFSSYSVSTTKEAAEIIAASHELSLENGILMAVPIPEEESANGKLVEVAINKSIEKAKEENIKGKDVTPFILEQISNLTDGKSLTANIALIKNNAKIGSLIAVEYAKLRKNSNKSIKLPQSHSKTIQADEMKENKRHNKPCLNQASGIIINFQFS